MAASKRSVETRYAVVRRSDGKYRSGGRNEPWTDDVAKARRFRKKEAETVAWSVGASLAGEKLDIIEIIISVEVGKRIEEQR